MKENKKLFVQSKIKTIVHFNYLRLVLEFKQKNSSLENKKDLMKTTFNYDKILKEKVSK